MSEYTFKLPDLGEGMVESEIAEWFIKVGEHVNEEDIVGTMMTDKAAVELSSPVTGKVTRLGGEPGDMVAVGAALVVFEVDAVAADVGGDVGGPSGPTAVAAKAAPTSPTADPVAAAGGNVGGPSGPTPTPATNKRVVTSPAIRRRAKEAGVDLSIVQGTGQGGRILRQDFDDHVENLGSTPVFAGAASAAIGPVGAALAATAVGPKGPPTTATPATGTREIKVIGLRRIIAERMAASKREIPHFAYVEEIDITEVEALRKHLNSKKENPAERLTILPFLGMALIKALREFPQCNATYDKDRNVIIQHNAVHLGVATQTPDGLKVPVVRHAEALTLDGLATEIRRMSGAARDNSAKKDDLSGSTITITSLGKLGGIASTPVINMPEVGIIGVNRAAERPMVFNGQITVRLMMNLSSSFDHRFVDGYDAAAMIQRIKEMLEHPATIFLPD
ncbi:MAG: 2-oxo acid dehydrogenase subunit E2 [Gammaproteobacteria bacterium]|nr:MAG: 2-oxo acid dehydrogenase subunit E2 [Gammaproteobacteria bacterium]